MCARIHSIMPHSVPGVPQVARNSSFRSRSITMTVKKQRFEYKRIIYYNYVAFNSFIPKTRDLRLILYVRPRDR